MVFELKVFDCCYSLVVLFVLILRKSSSSSSYDYYYYDNLFSIYYWLSIWRYGFEVDAFAMGIKIELFGDLDVLLKSSSIIASSLLPLVWSFMLVYSREEFIELLFVTIIYFNKLIFTSFYKVWGYLYLY